MILGIDSSTTSYNLALRDGANIETVHRGTCDQVLNAAKNCPDLELVIVEKPNFNFIPPERMKPVLNTLDRAIRIHERLLALGIPAITVDVAFIRKYTLGIAGVTTSGSKFDNAMSGWLLGEHLPMDLALSADDAALLYRRQLGNPDKRDAYACAYLGQRLIDDVEVWLDKRTQVKLRSLYLGQDIDAESRAMALRVWPAVEPHIIPKKTKVKRPGRAATPGKVDYATSLAEGLSPGD